MSIGPASTVADATAATPHIARSAIVLGAARLGEDALLAQGAVLRSAGRAVGIGAGSVTEPGAIVCDHSVLGRGCVVRAGAVVKQRSHFGDLTDIDGFPAIAIGRLGTPPPMPAWAFALDDLPSLTSGGEPR